MSQVVETSPRKQSRLPAVVVIISGIVVGVGTPLTWASIGGEVDRNYKGLDLPEGKYVLVFGILLLIIGLAILGLSGGRDDVRLGSVTASFADASAPRRAAILLGTVIAAAATFIALDFLINTKFKLLSRTFGFVSVDAFTPLIDEDYSTGIGVYLVLAGGALCLLTCLSLLTHTSGVKRAENPPPMPGQPPGRFPAG